MRTALLSTLFVGGLIGLTSLLAPFTGWPIGAAHRFQHIHLQSWSFIGGFVLGAGFRIVPQLSGTEPPDNQLPRLAGLLFAGATLIWVFVLPFAGWKTSIPGLAIAFASVIELVVWGIFVSMMFRALWNARKKGCWKGVVAAGLTGIYLCVLLNAIGWMSRVGWLDLAGTPMIRRGYMGFLFVGVPLLAMGICGRAIRQPEDPDWAYLCGVILVTTGTVAFSRVIPSDTLAYTGSMFILPGFVLFGYGISFHRQFDRLNIPGFSHGVVVAFSFVLAFALFFTLRTFTDVPFANRGMIHVWSIGFLTVLIVAFGTWIFPAAAGRTPINSPSTVVAIYILATGTLLRVLTPVLVSVTGGDGTVHLLLLLCGGLLQYTGIAVFAVTLWPNLPAVVEKA